MGTKNKTRRIPRCFYCMQRLHWDFDFEASEAYPFSYNEDDGAILSMYHCPNCGRTYEILDPIKEKREKDYSNYWNTRNDK